MHIGLVAKGTKHPLFCLSCALHPVHTNTPALFPQANHVNDIQEMEESLPALPLPQAGQTYVSGTRHTPGERPLFSTRRAAVDPG